MASSWNILGPNGGLGTTTTTTAKTPIRMFDSPAPAPTTVNTPSTPSTPSYNFTQTPAQNSYSGNDLGFSGGSGFTVNTTPSGYQNPLAETSILNDTSHGTNNIYNPATVPPKPVVNDGRMTYDEFKKLYDQNNTNPNNYATLDQITKLFADNAPKPQKAPDYNSILSSDINDQIKQLLALQKQGYTFDPTTDAALKAAQTQSMNRVKQDMASRGRLSSSLTDTQMQQAAQGLIPQYQQLADQRTSNQFNNTLQSLSAIQGLDNTAYGRYRDNVGNINTANTNAYNQYKDSTSFGADQFNKQETNKTTNLNNFMDYNSEMSKLDETKRNNLSTNQTTVDKNLIDAEVKQYSRPLTEVARPYVSAFQSALQIPGITEYLQTHQNDLAQEINRLQSVDKNDPLIPVLQGARVLKVLSDPSLLVQYGKDYGFTPSSNDIKAVAEIHKAQLDSYLKEIEAKYAETKAKDDIIKIEQEIIGKNYDNAEKLVKSAYIEENEKLAIQSKIQQIKSSEDANTRGWNADARAETSANKEKKADEKSSYFDQYATTVDNKIEKLNKSGTGQKIYDPVENKWVASPDMVYTSNPNSPEHKQIYDYIMSLPVTETEKEVLFRTNNIPY